MAAERQRSVSSLLFKEHIQGGVLDYVRMYVSSADL